MVWHVARGVPQWFRYSNAVGWRLRAQIIALPLLLPSILARGSEMIAMYATMLTPSRMKVFSPRS
jgi:hypothetical protein